VTSARSLPLLKPIPVIEIGPITMSPTASIMYSI
jgi:hypothetical protein